MVAGDELTRFAYVHGGNLKQGRSCTSSSDRASCDTVPLAVVTSTELASALPGHQARNHPLLTLARTSVPSERTSASEETFEAHQLY